MSADLLALYDTDKAAFVLGVGDLREQRAQAMAGPGWWPYRRNSYDGVWAATDPKGPGVVVAKSDVVDRAAIVEHIAAEASPAHALAAVRRWRGVVERHLGTRRLPLPGQSGWQVACRADSKIWPCPDVTETADEAKAYLGGAA